jgi:hypothetical protein
VAAKDSIVGQSPQLAMTTSGSPPWSLLAQSQMPTPPNGHSGPAAGQLVLAKQTYVMCETLILPGVVLKRR